MKEHYVSFEQSQALKRLGFKEEVTHYYKPEDTPKGQAWLTFSFTACDHNRQPLKGVIPKYSAPRLDQAQAWLREEKGIAINVIAHDGGKWEYDIVFLPNAADGLEIVNRSSWCRSYEEALIEGLDEALKLLGKEDKQ